MNELLELVEEEQIINFMFKRIKDARNITTEEFRQIDFIYRLLPYDKFEHFRHCVIAKQESAGIIKVGAGECRVRH